MKKIISLALVLVMMLMVFAGCGAKPEAPAAKEEAPAKEETTAPVTEEKEEEAEASTEAEVEAAEDEGRIIVEFWYCWGDAIAETNIALADMFNKSQDKYYVVATYQGSYVDEQNKLQAAYVAGEQPTVALNESASGGIFAEAGIALDLNEFAERDGFDIDNINKGLLTNSIFDGKFTAVPYMRSIPLVLMNKTMLEANGLDPAGPKTWEEMKEYGEVLNANGITALEFPIVNEWYFEAYINQAGGSLLNADESAVTFNSDAGVKALNYWREISDAGYAKIFTGADAGTIYKADFLAQNTAMIVSSCADITYFIDGAKEAGFEVSCAFMPMDQSYAIPTGGAQLILCDGNSEAETEGGWEFIKFLCSDEAQILMSQKTGYVPATYSSVESDTMAAFYAENPQYKVAVDQLEYIVARPNTKEAAEAYSQIKTMLEEFLLDDSVSAEDVLAKYEEICNEILAG